MQKFFEVRPPLRATVTHILKNLDNLKYLNFKSKVQIKGGHDLLDFKLVKVFTERKETEKNAISFISHTSRLKFPDYFTYKLCNPFSEQKKSYFRL